MSLSRTTRLQGVLFISVAFFSTEIARMSDFPPPSTQGGQADRLSESRVQNQVLGLDRGYCTCRLSHCVLMS